MSDENETTTDQQQDQQAAVTEVTPEPTVNTETDSAEDGKASKEARRYRRQLRDTEAERDTLKGTVDALRRRMVEQAAARQIVKPEALWAAGVELGDLLDADGLPDAEKIRAACSEASGKLGLSRPIGGNYVPSEGRPTHPGTGGRGSFADAFRPGAGRDDD